MYSACGKHLTRHYEKNTASCYCGFRRSDVTYHHSFETR